MKDKIMEIIESFCALNEDIAENSSLKEISLDSLSFISAVVRIEEEFSVEFEDEQLSIYNFEVVGDIIMAVEDKVYGSADK